MRKQGAVLSKGSVLRRLVQVSAVAVGAGLLLAGCGSPVKFGSAAVMSTQRITIATLNTEVTNLNETVKQYPGVISLNQKQQTQETLGWLVKFQITDELAQQAGITVSAAQSQQALDEIYSTAKSEAQQAGVQNVTLPLILAANGIPPNQSAELGRYQAIQTQFAQQANGGTLPSTTAQQTAATNKLNQAQCQAAKSLKIEINPQYGRLDYSSYEIVAAPATVFRTSGPVKASSTAGAAPAC
jgi:outer membrane murein-binding lipoprotein Lpp